ncbi:hypothetical protein FK178_06125 [Antarcticibacterium arcticum]|uniref:Membrane or secreted protein n=1 Tax=Antarcticibacterium arcticum TaxID=2585771 RepID=A0A5B8YKE3_9FLAO|nr:hypothetical protein [Antarcticibacterium arcticum]QED37317.1 hypothetical protein FK178_06125 [Antarcticibacterium arcticum]
MKRFFKTGLLLMAISISVIACRETNEADDVNNDDLRTEAGAEVKVSEDGSKVKIKTDDKKVKIKTDDDGEYKEKVKIDNDDN